MALLALLLFLASPPPREGAADLVLLRTRDLLGQVLPGQGTPTFPGWTTWLGALLAGIVRPLHLIAGDGATLTEFLSRTVPLQTTLLRWTAAFMASGCVLVASQILTRVLASPCPIPALSDPDHPDHPHDPHDPDHPDDPQDPDHPDHPDDSESRPVRLFRLSSWVRLGPARPALIATLLLAPQLTDLVAGSSPALLGGFLWLCLTVRLLEVRKPGDLRWGAVSGLWLAILLGACGWLWATVPVFLLVAICQRRGSGPISTALVTAVGVGLALDPGRLLDPATVVPRVFAEWSRAGGWNLASSTLGSRSVVEMLSLSPLVGWGVPLTAACAAGFWLRNRRFDLLVWWGGLFVVAVLVPVASGIRGLDLLQQSWGPLFVVAGAAAVGHLTLPGVGRSREAALLGAALILGAGYARLETLQTPASVPPAEVVARVAAVVPPRALVLAERAVPGLEEVCRLYTLPRDSRLPERFEFVYWPRWYSGFDYVLLSEVQVGQNAARTVPLHFYGQLREQGEVVERWGREESGWVLYRIAEASPWRTAPALGELSQFTAVPELLQFLDQLGSFYAGSGEPDRAATLFQAGLGLDPGRGSYYNNLGSVYLLESEWEEAARVFEEGLRRNPRSAELCYNSGRAFFELGAYGRAEELLRRAVGLRPDFADAHYELARTFLALGQPSLARRALEEVLSLGPSPERRAAVESVLQQLPKDGAAVPAVPALPGGS